MSDTRPFGSWPSPISSEQLTQQSVRLGEPQITQAGTYWIESRPEEQGRCVLMFQAFGDARPVEMLASNISVRTRAHEYGGASYLVTDSDLFFVDAGDQRVYHVGLTEPEPSQPVALTPAGAYRYADFCLDTQRQQLICVREDHTLSGAEETNELVAIDLRSDNTVKVIASGHDFFSNPRVTPNGLRLSWLCWDHPHMPWDASECWVAGFSDDSTLINPERVAGGEGESIFQPQWGPNNTLYLVSDRNDWWNLYRVKGPQSDDNLEPITHMSAEFATPQWVFGMSTYGFLSHSEILACYSRNGEWALCLIDLTTGELSDIETPYCDISMIQCANHKATFLAANHTTATQLLSFDGQQFLKIADSSGTTKLDPQLISRPQAVTFNTANGDTAHAFYYAPHNPLWSAPEGQQPPLIVLCHGGPTGATSSSLNIKIQYWTSRGFAVIDVNYRGSTGYGRHYREQLNGAWGIHDVEDVCAAANYLIDRGLANPEQVAIKGSSAGGYTVLAALTFSDTFKAGASLYGIGDLETLATDTHKFEARYLDSLVGPYPAEKALYQQRSPIHHTEHLNCPVIFFQGLDDKVVPPNQAQAMVDALNQKHVAVAYVPFNGEGHGFRQANSIKRCIEAEWSFYGQIFGFDVDDTIEPVTINNLTPKALH